MSVIGARRFGAAAAGLSVRDVLGDVRRERADAEPKRRSMREYGILIPEAARPLRLDDFPFQIEPFYDDEIAEAEEVVYQKSTQIGACLDQATKVLTADLRWVRLDEVREGDEVVAVDEVPATNGRGSARQIRRATVQAVFRYEDQPRRRLTFDNGVTLVATPRHRLLVPGPHGARWVHVHEMGVGTRIRRLVDPWGIPSYEDGWLGGVLDGEGSLRKRSKGGQQHGGTELVITQQINEVYQRVLEGLNQRGFHPREGRSSRPNGRPDVGQIKLTRLDEIMALVGQARPSRFVEGTWWQDRGLPGKGANGGARPFATVTEIEDVGTGDVMDLQTSTGTYIAEGLVSHNSTGMIRWAVRLPDQFGETAIYFFPTSTHVKEFGTEKLEPSIEASGYLQSRIPRGHTRNKSQKQIGLGFLYLRGMQSKASVQSIPAQAVVIDEYDECPPQRIEEAENRISGAAGLGKVGRVRRLGRPSVPGYGIDAAFQESDQRAWMVTCPECKLEQRVTFADNLRWHSAVAGDRVLRAGHDEFEMRRDVVKAWRACSACDASLEGQPIRRGRWVPQSPGPGRVPGFHIPRLIVPRTDLRRIVVNSRKTKIIEIETFHNHDLGEAWAAADARLTDEDLMRAAAEGLEPQTRYRGRYPVTMGLDVASERDLNCRISEILPNGQRRALRIWEPRDYDEVAKAMVDFRVHVAVVDSMPERRGIGRPLQAAFPGRVYLAEYADNPKADAFHYDEKRQIITVNRTEALDAMMDSIRSVTNIPTKPMPAGYVEQMKSPVRKLEEDKKGRPFYAYRKTGTQGDDYAHAEVYDLVAQEMLHALTITQQEHEAGEPELVETPEPVRLGWGHIGYRRGFE